MYLISEPPINPGKKDLFIPSDNVKAYYVMEETGKSYQIYSAIYISNKHLNWRPVTEISSATYTEIEVTINGFILRIGSIYAPNNATSNINFKTTMTTILASREKRIIGGDFNAHHDSWEGRGIMNESGRFFNSLFEKLNWIVCNEKGCFTRRPRANEQPSTIDLTIASSAAYSLVKNWYVTDNSYNSDHLCIQFEINKKSPAHNVGRIDVPSKKVAKQVLHAIRNNKGIELTYETLLLLYQQSRLKLSKQLPKLIPGTTFTENKKINLIRRKINKINKTLKQYSSVSHFAGQELFLGHVKEVNSLTHQLKIERCKLIKLKEKEINYLKAKALKKRIELKGEAAIWKELNIDIKASHGLNIVNDDEGNIITNHKELIYCIMKKLANKQSKYTRNVPPPQKKFLDHPLQEAEIERAVESLKSAKAKGADGIGASLLKELYKLDKKKIQDLIRGWWDQASTPKQLKQTRLTLISKSGEAIKKLDSFRPIGVGNHLLVLYEKILNERLYFFVNKNLLVKEQIGYRKGLSLMDSISPFIEFITESINAGHRTIVWKADIESAFDKIRTDSILETLKDHIPNKLWLILKDLLTDREVIYKSNDPEYTITFPKYNGTTQGSVLSPTLFVAVMGEMHKKFKKRLEDSNLDKRTFNGPFSYADDLFGAFKLPTEMPYDEAMNEVRRTLTFIEQTLNSILKSWNLNLANSKLECIITKTRCTLDLASSISSKCNFSLKSKIKILGLTLGSSGGSLFGYHVEEKCQEVKELIEDYRKNTLHYTFNLRKTIVHRVLLPKLFYLGEIWAGRIKPCHESKLNSIIRLLSIYIIGGVITTSHVAASMLAGIPPASIWLQELNILESITSHGILYEGNILKLQKKSNVTDHFHPACIPQPSKIQLHYTHEELLEVEGTNDLHIYTDASLNKTNGGIAIVAPKSKKTILLKTHKLTNIHELEVKAIQIALLMAEELFNEDKRLLKKIVILSDSLSSLMQIQNTTSTNSSVHQIRKCIQYHSNLKRIVHLIWVKGHNDVYGNELADSLAKTASNTGHPYIIDIPIAVMKKHLAIEQRAKWKDWYQKTITSTSRFADFFNVNEFPPDLGIKPNHNLTALLTSHSQYYNDYKHRFLNKTDGKCPCDGISIQTGHHAITTCTLLREIRLETYMALGIEPNLYEHKSLNNIKKDAQFIKFITIIANKVKDQWK